MRVSLARYSFGRVVGRRTLAAALIWGSATVAHAQVVTVPATPQVGSSNPATAEPPVTRPHGKPCVVPLFHDLAFADFNPKSFPYTPPSSCPGPWAKVVFTADFTVSAGRQYDRTAAFYLGHASIYYGTTAEPRSSLSPSWHVERDVTDLSAIFQSTQTGEANIGNFVGVYNGVTYNGIIYANAALEFYPATRWDAAASAPDIVVPVNGSGGDAGTLNTGTDQITQALNLPTNVQGVYLDVIAQSQSNDEFWYFCVPNDEAANLLSCGNTAFRETEVTIDGVPAGVAPVYPWIFTGGIDPYLWEPVTGVQTLAFRPYRVDLTPFAGLLGNGSTHTIGIGVYNADSYFLATANVLVYTDHGGKPVTGAVTGNTLSAAPTPAVSESISVDSTGSVYSGSVLVTSKRGYTISGYVDTSHGRVQTTVHQDVGFSSYQTFQVNPTLYAPDIQDAQQLTTVDSQTTTREGGRDSTVESHLRYPLVVDYAFLQNADGTYTQTTTVDQRNEFTEMLGRAGFAGSTRTRSEQVHSTDVLSYDANFNILANSASKSSASYLSTGGDDDCYSRKLTSASQVLLTVVDGDDCR